MVEAVVLVYNLLQMHKVVKMVDPAVVAVEMIMLVHMLAVQVKVMILQVLLVIHLQMVGEMMVVQECLQVVQEIWWDQVVAVVLDQLVLMLETKDLILLMVDMVVMDINYLQLSVIPER